MGLLLCGGASPALDPNLEELVVITTNGAYAFQVEIADEPRERRRGLMFRRQLPSDRGMLFISEREEVARMWMKNTFIPLDMIFIAGDGRVAAIVENAEPRSERILSSGVPVRAVLEVAGGTVARLGIRVGDRVGHRLFAQEQP
ncbi:MAG: DUF192 domain-containing protein [Alphaproteobacteria bacterium]|nr:MAG: DUF192 domain-containing protein [Alphaproteobacteria bacterium]